MRLRLSMSALPAISLLAPAALAAQEDRQAALAELMQPDGIHPNAKGVALIVEDMGPSVLELIAE